MRTTQLTGLLLTAFALSPCAAQPVGPTFDVTAQFPVYNIQSMAPIADTGYVVVWTAPDGDGHGVFGQRIDVQGNLLGTSFRVNTFTTGNQYEPSVGAGGLGEFTVVWDGQGPSVDRAVFFQRYQSTGAPVGGPMRVNVSTTTGLEPSVAYDQAGQFVVVWQAFSSAGSNFNVFARRFAINGDPIGTGAFRVNTNTANGAYQPQVTAWPDGFLVVWGTGLVAGADIIGQRYDANENPLGGDFRVNPTTGGHHTSPSVDSRSDGSFVVAWDGVDVDGDGTGVRARRYDPSGTPQGTGFELNTYTTGDQRFPRVAFDPVGNFLAVWQSVGQAPDATGVHGRLFKNSGAALTAEFRVNTAATAIVPAVAASASEGRFLVAWYGTDREIARRVAIVGDANGDGAINVDDVFYIINRLFAGGPALVGVGDVNADGSLDVADVFYLINYLFAGGPPPV